MNIVKFIIPVLLIVNLVGCRDKLEDNILLKSEGQGYLVNINFSKIKHHKNSKNDYFGMMYFANLSNKSLHYSLLENIASTNKEEKYDISVKYDDNFYAIDFIGVDTLTSKMMDDIEGKQIKAYEIVVSNIPDNFNWHNAKIVVNDRIFE